MITTEPMDDDDDYFGGTDAASSAAPRPAPSEETAPRSFADLQGKMTFVQAGSDPFNNAVSFSSANRHRYEAAEVMPSGYDDTEDERKQQLDLNPKDDNALLAPRREEIEEFLEASSDLFRRRVAVASSNTQRLGARSTLWPALPDEDYEEDGASREPPTSYSNYGASTTFDRRAEEAMRRGTPL